MRDRFFRSLAHLTYHHYKIIIFSGFALTLLMGWFASHLEIKLSFINLFPPENIIVKQFNYAYENFGGMDFLFIAVESDDIEQAKAFADTIAPRLLAEKEYVHRVEYKFNLDHFKKHGLLYLDLEDLEELQGYMGRRGQDFAQLVASPGVHKLYRTINNQIDDFLDRDRYSDDQDDVLNAVKTMGRLVEITDRCSREGRKVGEEEVGEILEDIFVFGQEDEFEEKIQDEYLVSDDGGMLLIMVRATEMTDNLAFGRKFNATVDRIIEEAKTEFPGIKVSTTGMVAIQRDEMNAMDRDMSVTGITALTGVLLLFSLAYRRLSYLLYVGVPLVMGVICTFGVTYLTIGSLNMITALFTAILLGLGVDFAVHIIARYREERWNGESVEESISLSLRKSGVGILTGGFTTAIAFYSVATVEFRGVSQMGLIAGTGILICMLMMFTVLPALLAWKDRREEEMLEKKVDLPGLQTVVKYVTSHPAPILLMIGLVTAGALWQALQIKWNYNYLDILPKGLESVSLQYEVMDRFGQSTEYGMLVADDLEEAKEFTKALREKETVGFVDSITNYLPEGQEEKLPLIKELSYIVEDWPEGTPEGYSFDVSNDDVAQLVRELMSLRDYVLAIKQVAVLAGFFEAEDESTQLMKEIDGTVQFLRSGKEDAALRENLSFFQTVLGTEMKDFTKDFRTLTRTNGVSTEEVLEREGERYQGKDGKFVINAFSAELIWEEEFLHQNVAELRSVDPEASGLSIIFNEVNEMTKKDLFEASALALSCILFLLLFDFRMIKTAFFALIPLLIGVIWMVGFMSLIGMEFHMANVGVIPLLLGIGIDNGVHIIHRYRSEGKGGVPITISQTGRAIMLSSFTTMMGFGALSFATHQGMGGFGRSLLMGVGFCLFTSLIVLPTIIRILEDRWKI